MTPRTGLLVLLLPAIALAQSPAATPPLATRTLPRTRPRRKARRRRPRIRRRPRTIPQTSTPAPAASPPAGDAAIDTYKATQSGTAVTRPPAGDAARDTGKPAATTAPADAPTDKPGQTPAADANAPAIAPGKRDMLHAQILLERARFSPGQIDGAGGGNTRRAMAAFQRQQGLKESGELDEPTWSALEAHAPALVAYTITAQDVAGPFLEVPEDMMDKAKLDTLGYSSAAEAMGEQFHASPALLQRLNPGKPLDVAGTTLVVPNVAGLAPPPKAARVVVDRSDASVALEDAQGRTYARYPASTGSEHDPLPVGEWKINGVSLSPTFQYNPELFWDADPSHAKARIAPGPNNPVGVAWVDLSKPHYGIHGTPEPGTIGTAQSHGCIRLTNWSARELAQAVSAGMPALLQE